MARKTLAAISYSFVFGVSVFSAPTPTPTAAATPTESTPSSTDSYDPENEVPATEAEAPAPDDSGALFDAAHQIWKTYVPDSLKDAYEFPTREQWDAFFLRLRDALDADTFAAAAAITPEVKGSLVAMKQDPAFSNYADWLEEKMDLLDVAAAASAALTAAQEAASPTPKIAAPSPSPIAEVMPSPAPTPPEFLPIPSLPPILVGGPTPVPTAEPVPTKKPVGAENPKLAAVPFYGVWYKRIQGRPTPSRASELLPPLKAIFVAEGVPAELVWLAEVESSLNPGAQSPAGARGLFQLMPETARRYGLSTFPLDERTHPGKSARAAAKYLKRMKTKFGDWPLALAAYNAGDARVTRALKAKGANATFADIAPSLSVETRMYVPKVLATVAVREGEALD